MDLQQIIEQLTKQYGSGLDINKIKKILEGVDIKNLNMAQIVSMLTKEGVIGDLDGDGKVESLADEMKGVAEKMLGGGLGKILKNVTK